ncbi:hypothetical protein JOQ06_013207 [Pogonophryne albipinna]|uniref:Arachidonate 15-lipoxygenase B-like n=1 Tax=Pogonophryne albipinna TaxID=1090488 RepID=A0AAD6BJG7_9TELE|nr:hypothetical protein JOQ06_013207 [Pogonophryne albipinna]
MVNYKVTVFNGSPINAVTTNDVFIKLVGTDGEIEPNKLNAPISFTRTQVAWPVSIGKLILIKLVKKKPIVLPEVDWFPAKVEVESPDGETYIFPIYRWITDSVEQNFREGTALRVFEDSHPDGRVSREQELNQREKDYCWDVYIEGIPHIMEATDVDSLPSEVRFSCTKTILFNFTASAALTELNLKGIADSKDNWTDINDVNRVFSNKDTKISKYVEEHWKEDAFFGYQYLNGVNPMLIRRCTALPENFPVTDEMLFPDGQSSLADEMKNGNIFLLDYNRFDGLKANIVHGKQQYLMAPLVLLQKTPDDKLMPIAIQLRQTPAEDNPIFLPTDSEYDWLMAKMVVRSADFSEHELNVHLLRTHLLAEVYAVSLLRNVPMVHPLYKLLVPHTRYTLQINFLARDLLISESGLFNKYAASGGEALFTILQRSMSSITYKSLCMPDDIAERGMEDVPNYYYRDDGLKLWVIIQRFVEGVLSFYYKSDDEVQQDSELQDWFSDIFKHGFLSKESTGIPQRLSSVTELVKFVTMVLFTCSAQHSAVNDGQFDYGGWMPNSPFSLQLAPPTTKGTTSEATMLKTLPDIGTSAQGMAALWILSKPPFDFVPLGQFPEEHFTEEIPCQLIKDFQGELEVLSADIIARNIGLDISYTYMDPAQMENSVSI